MHDGMPYGRIQGQGQGHSREVDRQSPTGLIFLFQEQAHNTEIDRQTEKMEEIAKNIIHVNTICR